MHLNRVHVTLGLILVAVLVGGLAFVGLRHSGTAGTDRASATTPPAQDRSVIDASGARTRLSGLTPATGEPTVPGLATADPARDTVAQVAGPFDDRFTWSGLSFDGRGVTGTLTVTSDVSDLLELAVVAGFYDRAGTLVATRRFVHHATIRDEAGAHLPDERQRVVIRVPSALRSTVVAAAVGVPTLVNE